MKIGQYKIKNNVFLAPMAGVTDHPFRELCTRYGAGLTTLEMMSTNPRTWHTDKSKLRLVHNQDSGIKIVQIVGSDPKEMAEAARINVDYGAQIIDINMGCPAKKVNRKLAGSALLQYPDLVINIITAVVNAVDVPVTLKIRTGWNIENRNCNLIAQIAEQSGIQALTIHGRTRECMFKGMAEYDSIKAVKELVSIPVIANGDIISPQKAASVLKYTNADGIMIGRGALGYPWLFQEINNFLGINEILPIPSIKEQALIMLDHVLALHDFYGNKKGLLIARKHVAWYLKNIKLDAEFKSTFNLITDPKEQILVLKDFVYKIQSLDC